MAEKPKPGRREGEQVDPGTRIVIDAFRSADLQRTIRYGFVCATVLGGIALVCYTVVKVNEQPPWAQVIIAAINIIPFALMLKYRARVFKFTLRMADVAARSQAEVDKERASSNLMPDGTSDPKDPLS